MIAERRIGLAALVDEDGARRAAGRARACVGAGCNVQQLVVLACRRLRMLLCCSVGLGGVALANVLLY